MWPSATPVLLSVARDAAAEVGHRKLESLGEFERLTALLAEDQVVRVPFGDPLRLTAEADRCIRQFSKDLEQKLVVPVPERQPARGTLTPDDCSVLMAVLAGVGEGRQGSDATRVRGALALALLRQTVGSRRQLRQALGRFEVFRCKNYRTGAEETLSWDALGALRERGLLFALQGQLAGKLQQALSVDVVHLLLGVEPDDLGRLFETPLPACDRPACLASLQKCPPLTPAADRIPLFRDLRDQIVDHMQTNVLCAMRYLLHANGDRFADVSSQLLMSDDSVEFWGKLCAEALEQSGERWRSIPPELAAEMSAVQAQALCVARVTAQSVEALLLELEHVDWIDGETLTQQERVILLRAIENDELWKRLPVHETVDSLYVSVCGVDAFIESKESGTIPQIPIPIVLLRGGKDTRPLYEQHGFEEWTTDAALNLLLDANEPSAHPLAILEVLAACQQGNRTIAPEVLEKLRSVKWLATARGPAAPLEMALVPEIADDLAALNRDPRLSNLCADVSCLAPSIRQHVGLFVVGPEIFATGGTGLQLVARALASVEDYRLGLLQDQCADKASIDILLGSLGEASEVPSPVLPLLSRVRHSHADHVVEFVKELSLPLPIAVLRKTLQHLTDRHRRQESSLVAVRSALRWYLQSLLGIRALKPMIVPTSSSSTSEEIGSLEKSSRLARRTWIRSGCWPTI